MRYSDRAFRYKVHSFIFYIFSNSIIYMEVFHIQQIILLLSRYSRIYKLTVFNKFKKKLHQFAIILVCLRCFLWHGPRKCFCKPISKEDCNILYQRCHSSMCSAPNTSLTIFIIESY